MKTMFAFALLIILPFNARASQIEYESEQLKQRVEKQEIVNTPRNEPKPVEPELSEPETEPPHQSEKPSPATDEGPLGNMLHSSVPQFSNATASRDANNPESPISFVLDTTFRNPDNEDKNLLSIASITVFATSDNGVSWASAPMRLTRSQKRLSQTWQGKIPASTFNGAATVTYYFTAVDVFGNITTELPLTSPGWPPHPKAFFAAAQDKNNSDDIFDPVMDILKTWIARDNDNIYVATQLDGPFSKGTVSPAYIHIYTNKFTDPAAEPNEGLMVGKSVYTAPLTFTSPEIIDFSEILSGRPTNFCDRPRAPGDPSGAIAGKLLFTKTPIRTICAEPCQSLNLVSFTLANLSIDAFMPTPFDSSPYTFIYLRSHTLAENQTTETSGSTSAASPVPPDQQPAAIIALSEISPKKDEKRCPLSVQGTPFQMSDREDFDFGIGDTIKSITNTAIIGGILYILAK